MWYIYICNLLLPYFMQMVLAVLQMRKCNLGRNWKETGRSVTWTCCSNVALKELLSTMDRETPVRWQVLREGIRGQTDRNHNHRKLTNLITWTTALSISMKLWPMPCRSTQDRQVMVERSDRMWSTAEGMANHFSILALRTHELYEKAKRCDPERWAPQVGTCPICYWRSVEK